MILTQLGDQWINVEQLARIYIADDPAAGGQAGTVKVRIEMGGGANFPVESFRFVSGLEHDRAKEQAQIAVMRIARQLAGHQNLNWDASE